jgi:hypothetical protein
VIAESIQRRPLGDLLADLDDATTQLLDAAKRAPKVKPNGRLQATIDRVRDICDDLDRAQTRKDRR